MSSVKNQAAYFKTFIQREPILAVAAICALATMCFVPPDKNYIHYIDVKTLFCLFCLMVSVKGIECEGVLTAISENLASRLKNIKALAFMLVFTCFFVSMLITNDVALIAFVPVTLAVFSMYGSIKQSAIVIVLQTLAANIGSSLAPIGNPQNLYLFMHYQFPFGSFLLTTLPFVLFGGVLLAAACFFVPNHPIHHEPSPSQHIRKKPVAVYCAMFVVAVAAVINLLPYWASAIIITAAAFMLDRRTLMKIDYSLLLTFVVIFIVVENIARIEWIHDYISLWMQKDCMLTAIGSSQIISNVPAAVMLSEFTDNATQLLLGVSVGGMGTLIASMASVISYRMYAAAHQKGIKHYLWLFTLLNVIFLLSSIVFVKAWGRFVV